MEIRLTATGLYTGISALDCHHTGNRVQAGHIFRDDSFTGLIYLLMLHG